MHAFLLAMNLHMMIIRLRPLQGVISMSLSVMDVLSKVIYLLFIHNNNIYPNIPPSTNQLSEQI